MFAISPELNGYSPERTKQLFERVEESLSALPGANGVTSGQVALLSGNNWNNSMRVEGFEAGPDTNTAASFNPIGPAYFRTLGIPVLWGREFSRTDAKSWVS